MNNKSRRRIIEIDEDLCTGCGKCADACSEGAIEIKDGKARLVSEKYCDGLGACLGECPFDALKITEREAEEFDAEAVDEYLKTLKTDKKSAESEMPCGCPSTHIREFSSTQKVASPAECAEAGQPPIYSPALSSLTHWPIQLKLIPATAPFLDKAHLLVAADCTTVALPNLHEDFLKGRVIMIGCPKFDDTSHYLQKFSDIFSKKSVKDITVLVMEVPCCQGLPLIVKKGMELAGKNIPIEKIVIGPRGRILQREVL